MTRLNILIRSVFLVSAVFGTIALVVPVTASFATSYRETFDDGAAQDWTSTAGTWTVGNGEYRSSAGGPEDIAILDSGAWTTGFTYRVRMINDYNGTGNLIGAIFNYRDASNYYEVKFAGSGGAVYLNSVIDGVRATVISGTYNSPAGAWLDLKVVRSGNGTTVMANGITVFDNIVLGEPAPGIGKVGLATTWSTARFENVSLSAPYSEDFDDGAAQGWTAIAGSWTAEGGVPRNSSAGPAEAAVFSDAEMKTDFVYSVSMVNHYGGTGNRVGAVFNYQDQDNYYVVKFAASGAGAYLDKVIDGTVTNVATSSYSGAGGTWFDLDVVRSGANTTVKVDGEPIFDNFTQNQLGPGKIGVYTEWSEASFDDVSLTGPELLFATGFEGISLAEPSECWNGPPSGCWQEPTGTDAVTGFSFPIELWGGNSSGFQMIVGTDSIDPSAIDEHMKNEIPLVTGPHGTRTHALYQEVTQRANEFPGTQNAFLVFPPTQGFTLEDEEDVYISYYIRLQPDIADQVQLGKWRPLSEFKTAGDYRIVFAVTDWDLDEEPDPVFTAQADNQADAELYDWYCQLLPPPCTPPPYEQFGYYEDPYGTSVPAGEWFRVELFWHRSFEADGRFWTAVNGTTLFDVWGKNVAEGFDPQAIDRVILLNAYSGGPAPFYQWIDDVEIWNAFPPTASPH
jgi:hypothetical protein